VESACADFRRLNETNIHGPFFTPFSDEILEKVMGNEAYSLTNGFSSYHQIQIPKEDKKKTTFAMEWESYAYNMKPFELKNAPMFSNISLMLPISCFLEPRRHIHQHNVCNIVVAVLQEYIHKFLEVYLDDWIVYSFLKDCATKLRSMLDRWRQTQLLLNIKKCIFCTSFNVLLGHIICKEGLLVDLAKILIMVNLSTLENVSTLWSMLGHTRYYCRFINEYAKLTM
jgi:hypothetical protein